MKIHPYALIIGLVLGLMVLVALRHPLFAIFAAVLAVFGFDFAFKANANKKIDKDE